eukprot:TRINITY_DN19152_c0_g1_i1.p1 TRINITY_DN19152_c0_g1~~TRINITY_DN19152_c0_g1_i1.p1  ORF type:complete len:202 (+),score=21.28 TRINITY_DN19152_c0_g1_i1:25-606(+)
MSDSDFEDIDADVSDWLESLRYEQFDSDTVEVLHRFCMREDFSEAELVQIARDAGYGDDEPLWHVLDFCEVLTAIRTHYPDIASDAIRFVLKLGDQQLSAFHHTVTAIRPCRWIVKRDTVPYISIYDDQTMSKLVYAHLVYESIDGEISWEFYFGEEEVIREEYSTPARFVFDSNTAKRMYGDEYTMGENEAK